MVKKWNFEVIYLKIYSHKTYKKISRRSDLKEKKKGAKTKIK